MLILPIKGVRWFRLNCLLANFLSTKWTVNWKYIYALRSIVAYFLFILFYWHFWWQSNIYFLWKPFWITLLSLIWLDYFTSRFLVWYCFISCFSLASCCHWLTLSNYLIFSWFLLKLCFFDVSGFTHYTWWASSFCWGKEVYKQF